MSACRVPVTQGLDGSIEVVAEVESPLGATSAPAGGRSRGVPAGEGGASVMWQGQVQQGLGKRVFRTSKQGN